MPSKRRIQKREDGLSEEGWFLLTEDLWREQGETPLKVRLVADVNFPSPLMTILRKRRIQVQTAQELGYSKLADPDLLNRVAARGYSLITLDADFWSDKKIPLARCGGVIQIDSVSGSLKDSDGFELLIVFLKSMGGIGQSVKVKASGKQLFLKGIGFQGRKFVYEIRAIHPGIYARNVMEPK